MKLENYFIQSRHEYHHMVNDLQHHLKNEVYEEIVAFVHQKTDEAMEKVWQRLRNRYDELTRLEESMPDEPTKEDQNHYLQEFFKLTDPSKISKDLQNALGFYKIEDEYHDFIQRMSTQEHGEIFKRYLYPPAFFSSLRKAILHDIQSLTGSLKTYTEAIGKHAIVIDSINKGKRDKAFIKGGATLLGMLVGIPFAGAGVGALMGNDSNKINDSLNKVFKNWNSYIDRFNEFIKSLEDNYRLAMMTIYGGTLLRVNDQLNVYNFTFEEMALLSGHYSLTITQKERKETEKWIRETTNGVKELLKQKRWKEAIHVSMELFQIVKSRPVTARTELYDGKSTLYIAHMHYYLAFQESLLEEYQNGHRDSFYETTKKLYKDLPLLVHDRDIEADFSKLGHLLFRFVKEGLKRGKSEDLLVVPRYFERLMKRWETEGGYIGENSNSIKEFTEELKAFYIVEQFLENVLGLKVDSPNDEKEPKLRLNLKQIKELRKIDADIFSTDKLTQYLKTQYLKTMFLPWQNGWVMEHKKKFASVILGGVLLFGGYTYGGDIYQYSKNQLGNLSWFNKTEKAQESVTPAEPIITNLKITTEYANIRSNPSLNSKVIYSATQTDKLQYLNKEQVDDEGRTWYLVLLPDGQEGWISSKITKKIEE